MDLREKLINGRGYEILENLIPTTLLDDFENNLASLVPVRASSSDKTYAEKDDIKNLKDVSVWWSQMLDDNQSVQHINTILAGLINEDFPELASYAIDSVHIEKHSQWINPHVDTPHRFKKYNFDKRLLGIQCIIPIQDLYPENGSTGLVPFSQKRDFDIDLCYTDHYTKWFKSNAKQHILKRGSVLLYNCRVLHSSMPNNTDISRPAILINYLHKDLVEEIRLIDNIWNSNDRKK